MTPLKTLTLFAVTVGTWHILLAADDNIVKPPKISKPSAKDVKDPAEGRKIELLCEASGIPSPTYSWTRNGKQISDSKIIMNLTTGILSIAKYNRVYDGYFQCMASNDITTSIKAVAVAPTYFVKASFLYAWGDQATTAAPANVKAGQDASLTCDDPPDHFPPGQYKWYKQDKSGGEIALDDRVTIDEKGTLHFIYTKPEDEINRQNYKCAIYVGKLSMIVLGSPKVLLVESRTPIPNIKPRPLYHSQAVVEVIGGEAILECVFGGHPVPTVSWKNKDGELIASGGDFTLENYNKRLRINNLNTAREGTYVCEGKNILGTDISEVYLNVTSAPYLESPGKGLDTQTVPAGFDAIFSCDTVSAPGEGAPNRPTWFRNGQVLYQTNTEKFTFSADGKTLTVKNLKKPSDIMCFQCNVSNSVGYKFMDGCLNVILPITITVQPPLVQVITKGDIIDLTVHATTDPSMEAVMISKWYFKNRTYDQFPPFAVEDPIAKTLYINTTDMSKTDYESLEGNYTKEIFHNFQRVNVSINVILQDVTATAATNTSGPANNVSFHAIERSDIECTSRTMKIFVPKRILPNHQATMRDPNCTVTFNGTHHIVEVGLNDCGTTVEFTNTSVIFRNELNAHLASGNSQSKVNFGNDAASTIPIECDYDRMDILSLHYLPVKRHVRFFEKRYGHLDFHIGQADSDQFTHEIPASSYPLKVPLSDKVFIRVKLDNTQRNDVGIYADNCIATSSPSPADPMWYQILQNGCPASRHVSLHKSPAVNEVRFSFDAFEFRYTQSLSSATVSTVYIHCEVSACPLVECTPHCNTATSAPLTPHGRRRRGATGRASHLVSTGPLLLMGEEESPSSSTIVAAVSVSVAVVASVVAVIYLVTRKRGQPKYQIVPLEESN